MTPEQFAEIEAEYSDHSGPQDTLLDIIRELMAENERLRTLIAEHGSLGLRALVEEL